MQKGRYQFGSGDDGFTDLLQGKRVSKAAPEIELLGSLDELTAHLELILTKNLKNRTAEIIKKTIRDLHQIAAIIAGRQDNDCDQLLGEIETEIRQLEDQLETINGFQLIKKTESSAIINIARTICRRAERNCYQVKKVPANVTVYLNRLSTLYYALSRYEDKKNGIFF